MNDHQEPGKIILINGASSAGKSIDARALAPAALARTVFALVV
jgi:chloramphenicol 3-O-phosphotransferase